MSYQPPAQWINTPTLPAAERFRLAWQGRGASDYIFNFWSALGWTVLTCGVYGLYVIYQMVRRSRDHNRRRLELLDAATAFAWEQAVRQGLQEELTPNFQRAAAGIEVLRQMTSDFRDPVIWLVLSLVARGVVDIVAFVLLDQDLIKHDDAETRIEYELAVIFGRLGQHLPFPDTSRVKGQDNYVGRIIAAIFSVGIYMLWWFNDQMVVLNRHFETNWAQEDTLASAIQSLAGIA
jgi:hypothetical protein